VGRGHLLEIELNDQERRAVGRLLMERKALLIETTEDTTQPEAERRAGLIELLVVAATLRKLRLRGVTSTGGANVLEASLAINPRTVRPSWRPPRLGHR
jgi:hypothetical protein